MVGSQHDPPTQGKCYEEDATTQEELEQLRGSQHQCPSQCLRDKQNKSSTIHVIFLFEMQRERA